MNNNQSFNTLNFNSGEIKFNAFFDYLRSFSEAGIQTLNKLQNQFSQQIQQSEKDDDILLNMKSLLSAYEIFVIQMKDSCEFVQIPEFGICVCKTFFQLIKMIKWLIRLVLNNKQEGSMPVSEKQYIKSQKSLYSNYQSDERNSNKKYICSFCQDYFVPAASKLIKRVGLDPQPQQFKQLVLEKYTQKNIQTYKNINSTSSGGNEMDIINKKHLAMKINHSANNENILQDLLLDFDSKAQSISRFVNTLQISYHDTSLRYNHQRDYLAFIQEMKSLISAKAEDAMHRMHKLVQLKIDQKETQRKNLLKDSHCQTIPLEVVDKEKYQKKIKNIEAALNNANTQIKNQKGMIEGLKSLLQSKSIQFQQQFLNFRQQTIEQQVKSKHMLKSIASIQGAVAETTSNHDQEKENQVQSIVKIKQSQKNYDNLRSPILSPNTILKTGIKEKSDIKSKRILKFKECIVNSVNSECQYGDQPSIQKTFLDDNLKKLYQKIDSYSQTEQVEVRKSETSPTKKCPNCKNRVIIQNKIKKELKNTLTSTPKLIKNIKIMNRTATERKPPKIFHQTQPINRKSTADQQVKPPILNTPKTNQFYSFVKKIDSLSSVQKESSKIKSISSIKTFKFTERPTFILIQSFSFSKEDLFNLFRDAASAQNYQTLNYRNIHFNDNNSNSKRFTLQNPALFSSDAQWNFKKEENKDSNIETKFVNYILYQLNFLKRKDHPIYQNLKLILRYPYQIMMKIDVMSLQRKASSHNDGDIQYSQMKRMMKFIFKLHQNCLDGDDKQTHFCEHLMAFAKKIGVTFKQ